MKTILIAVLIAAGAVAACPRAARAQSEWPWQRNLACDPAASQREGVVYCTGDNGRVHVVAVDLRANVRLEYLIAQGADKDSQFGECRDVNIPANGPLRGGCTVPGQPNRYPLMSLAEAAARAPNATAIVNGDYFGMDQSHGPEGLTIVRGDRLDGPAVGDTDNNAVNRPWLAAGRDAPLRVEIGQFNQDDGGFPAWMYTASGGAPWLVRSGEVMRDHIQSCRGAGAASCRANAEQTAAALSQDGRWLFLVVDLRKQGLLDTAQFLQNQLQARDAIKFDGGGSSQLWFDGRAVVPSSRRVAGFLAVVAGPGPDAPPTEAYAAEPATPVYAEVVMQDETAGMRVEMRNTGSAAWELGQGIELRQVIDGVPAGQAYPLTQRAATSDTVSWTIELRPDGNLATVLQYRMQRNGSPFGSSANVIVIGLPKELESEKERIQQLVEEQVEQFRRQAQQEADRLLKELERQIVEAIQRELERQARSLIDQLCGGSALLPIGAAGLVLIARRRRGHGPRE